MSEPLSRLPEPDLPQPVMPTLSQTVSKASRRYRRRARLALALALILVVAATITSLFQGLHRTVTLWGSTANVAAVGAGGAFLLAFAARFLRSVARPERVWYDSRALSEQTKSLAWTYAVGGSWRISLSDTSGQARAITADQYELGVKGLLTEAVRRKTPIRRAKGSAPVQNITDWMENTRRQPLPERARVYATQRIADQQAFYGKRTQRYAATARFWNVGLLVIEAMGVVAAALLALNAVHLDLIGVAGTLAAAGTAWLQFNQFANVSSKYAAMEYRLADCQRRCRRTSWTEDTWPGFVREVEDLLGEEHGAWRQMFSETALDVNQPVA